jgi:hypothetical protein
VADAVRARYGGLVDRVGFGAEIRSPEDEEAVTHIIAQLQNA